jgi:hypothetical protein
MLFSGLRFLDVSNPADPFIAGKRSQILPRRLRRWIGTKSLSQIGGHLVHHATGSFGFGHNAIILLTPILLLITLLAVPAWGQIPAQANTYRAQLTREARAAWGLEAPVAFFAAQVHQESGWREDARSPVGALGLAQFMPGTAAWIAGSIKRGQLRAPALAPLDASGDVGASPNPSRHRNRRRVPVRLDSHTSISACEST